MKYGIITLTYDDPLYNFFDDIKRQYYQKNNILNVFVYNVTTPVDKIKNTSDVIYVSNLAGGSGIYTMFDKFIATLQSNQNWNDFDYIIRANSSTFLNLPLLEEYIKKLPQENCYAGPCTMPITPKDFISGTCIIFSKDVIKMLSKIKEKHENRRLEDDLIIFQYMKNFKVPLTNIPMYWYDKNIIPTKNEISDILKKYPLIRINNQKDRFKIDTTIWKLIEENVNE